MKVFYRFMNKDGKLQFVEAKGKQHRVSKYTMFMTRGDSDKTDEKWILTEKVTGLKTGWGRTQKGAIEHATKRIEEHGEDFMDRQIEIFVKKYGVSPIADREEE